MIQTQSNTSGLLTLNVIAQLSLGLMTTTIILPSTQEWPAIFNSSQAAVQLTFSLYVVAFGLMQLVYGPLSDRMGRKQVLLFGLIVVMVGSMTAAFANIVGAPLRSAYSAAKHGLIGYHDSVRAENEHLGIQVHVVAPGSVNTNVSRNAVAADGSARGESDPAIESGMLPDEFAIQVLAAMDAGKREIILATGMELGMAVLRRQDPEQLFDRMSSMVRDGYVQKMAASRA